MILVALLFEALWRWPLKGAWATTLAGSAFGIYLLHPAAMLVAFKVFGAQGGPQFCGDLCLSSVLGADADLATPSFHAQVCLTGLRAPGGRLAYP